MVENYFKTGDYRTDSSEDEAAIAFGTAPWAIALPFWQSVQDILPRITTPLLIESAVWHEVGHYAGTVDLVCHFDFLPVILDWKTATKPKKAEYLDRYPLQLAAYCGAINRMYGTRIKNGVIVVALPDREAQVFRFALGDYWQPWLRRLVRYWEQQSIPLAEQALDLIHSTYGLCA
jgi:genome maintenance exonuclease 1